MFPTNFPGFSFFVPLALKALEKGVSLKAIFHFFLQIVLKWLDLPLSSAKIVDVVLEHVAASGTPQNLHKEN